MKCLCGYEHKKEWECNIDDNADDYKGKDEFVKVEGTFLTTGDDFFGTKREVSLYACPKCKTVQLYYW